MHEILFVCSANQCRSPMAEALFKAILHEKSVHAYWRVESAGVWAYSGAHATDYARQVMMERDLDLNDHRSQPADLDLVNQFDLVLVMERDHNEILVSVNPDWAEKIVLFKELVGEEGDFEDPVGGSIERYREAADELDRILRNSSKKIITLTRGE